MTHQRPLVLLAVLAILVSLWYPKYLERMSDNFDQFMTASMVAANAYDTTDVQGWNELYQNATNDKARAIIKKLVIEQALMEAIQKGRAAEDVRIKELEEVLEQSQAR